MDNLDLPIKPISLDGLGFFTGQSFSFNTHEFSLSPSAPKPKRIVRNGPAMVVFWTDGTKTVVKCHEEEFDFEKGLAMALARKMWGRSRTLAYLKKVEEQ